MVSSRRHTRTRKFLPRCRNRNWWHSAVMGPITGAFIVPRASSVGHSWRSGRAVESMQLVGTCSSLSPPGAFRNLAGTNRVRTAAMYQGRQPLRKRITSPSKSRNASSTSESPPPPYRQPFPWVVRRNMEIILPGVIRGISQPMQGLHPGRI